MQIHVRHEPSDDVFGVLLENRNIEKDNEIFFHPSIKDLHDPFLIPDMEIAVERILEARAKNERVVIFGDYDVDGVSGTAILVRFLTEIGMQVSYRLPHRVHDGYGLKKYFFDELKEKNVQLVITVDCGTRDIEAVEYAKSLGIDVIVTDHHAVPDRIPEGVPVLNPKRKDSQYAFPNLAGAGVAFKLLHGIAITMKNSKFKIQNDKTIPIIETGKVNNLESCILNLESLLSRYIDFAALGTVADCMPLLGENRTITTLGLKQMKQSHSHGLRKFLEDRNGGSSQKRSNSSENQAPKGAVSRNTANEDVKIGAGKTSSSELLDADIIGFQIGPRINAAGRMDTPLTALRWLLASEERCDEFLEEIEELNVKRQKVVKDFAEKALIEANPDDGILFFVDEKLEHGIIGLVAGKLTETYNRPSIVLCEGKSEGGSLKGEDVKRREYENQENLLEKGGGTRKASDGGLAVSETPIPLSQSDIPLSQGGIHLVASCRSPEWCNLVELLDECKDFFVRYGGHRQAAGFTIETAKLEAFKKKIVEVFQSKYDTSKLPEKVLNVESALKPSQATLETLDIINRFRPFGIGNPKPLWLLEGVTIASVKYLGSEQKHLSLTIAENQSLRLLFWNSADKKELLEVGNIVSLAIELEENEWNGRKSVQAIVRDIAEV